jgi:hypothetical protein
MTFDDLQERSVANGETKDCAVKAVAVVTGTDYDTVLRLFYRLGRRPGTGTSKHMLLEAIALLGYKLDPSCYRSKTVVTLEREFKNRRGRYLVWTRNHLLAVVDGEVVDWTKGRRHRVRAVSKVYLTTENHSV